jgi:RNA polymerase sigma-70 factor (ECF subfamily)
VSKQLLERVDVAGLGGALKQLLTDDAVLVADAGPGGGRYGRVRQLPRPIVGARKIAAFTAAAVPQRPRHLVRRVREVNGEPAIVTFDGARVYSAVLLAIANGRIRRVFICADPARLGHVAQRAVRARHAARS